MGTDVECILGLHVGRMHTGRHGNVYSQAALKGFVQLLLQLLAFSFSVCGLLVGLSQQDLLLLYCCLHVTASCEA